MKNERERLITWKDEITMATRYLKENLHIDCAFRLGFLVRAIMVALDEFIEEEEKQSKSVNELTNSENVDKADGLSN